MNPLGCLLAVDTRCAGSSTASAQNFSWRNSSTPSRVRASRRHLSSCVNMLGGVVCWGKRQELMHGKDVTLFCSYWYNVLMPFFNIHGYLWYQTHANIKGKLYKLSENIYQNLASYSKWGTNQCQPKFKYYSWTPVTNTTYCGVIKILSLLHFTGLLFLHKHEHTSLEAVTEVQKEEQDIYQAEFTTHLKEYGGWTHTQREHGGNGEQCNDQGCHTVCLLVVTEEDMKC